MAQRIQFGVVLSGDHRGAVRSTQVTRRELKQLRGEVDKTGRAARDTNSRFQRWAKGMNTLQGAIGPLVGIAGVGMLARMSQQAIASTAAIQDQADAAGIGAGQFQELTKAMNDMAGVAESVSGAGLRRFNRRLGLARQGGGAAIKTLERLNISLRQDTPAALEEAIRKLAEIKNASDRAAAASELFGEDAGPQMATALGSGQEAIDATIERLHEMGRVMTDDTVEAASEMDRRFGEIMDSMSTRFKSFIVNSIDGWRDFLELTEEGRFEAMQEDLDRLAASRDRILDNIDKSPWPEELRKELQRVNEKMIEIQKRMQAIQGGPDDDEPVVTLTPAQRLLRDIDAKRADMGQSQAGLVRGGNPLEAFGPGSSRQTSFGGGVVGRSSQSPAGGPMLMAEGFRRLSEDADKAEESVDKVAESSERLNDLGNDLGLTFSSAFEDAIVAGKDLRDVMQGLLQDLLRIAVRKGVTEPAGNAIAQAFAGAFSGTSAGTHPAESADGNLFTKPGLTTIAERGEPEAVLPLERRGGKLGVRASGVDRSAGDTYVIDARGADAGQLTRLEQTIRSLNGSIERRSVEAVVQDALRGGRTKRAMG